MFKVMDASLDTDLSELSRLLWQHRISHRIIEHEQRRLVLVSRENQAPQAFDLFLRWQRGEVILPPPAQNFLADLLPVGGMLSGFTGSIGRTPLVILLIAACIILYFLAPLAMPTDLTWALLFPDFSHGTRVIMLERVIAEFSLQQFLKMLSPILLHGGPLHLVFNMLWLWELGKRIEQQQSSLVFTFAVLVLALLSNTAQYLYGGGNNFGGMSGVVYGLFAYIWMWQLFDPQSDLSLPRGLIVFFLLSLVVMTILQLDMIANEAHLGGFLAGMLYGAITASVKRAARAMK